MEQTVFNVYRSDTYTLTIQALPTNISKTTGESRNLEFKYTIGIRPDKYRFRVTNLKKDFWVGLFPARSSNPIHVFKNVQETYDLFPQSTNYDISAINPKTGTRFYS